MKMKTKELYKTSPAPQFSSSLSPRLEAVAAAIIDSDNRILIGKRPKGKPMEGYWEFPGGKIEENESPEDALKREIKEELGVALGCFAPFTFISERQENHHLIVYLYICREWKGIVEPLENQELVWVRPLELRNYELLPANKYLASMLRDHVK